MGCNRGAMGYERSATGYTTPQLWHLLSLDAPTVAALWTYFLAYCAGVAISWRCEAALFVAVWVLYAADRLLDARRRPGDPPPAGLEERHRFHWRHRFAFLPVLVAAGAILAWWLPGLGARSLRLYGLLSLALAGWLTLVHAPHAGGQRTRRLPKELAVGPFFAAAVAVPTVARAPELALWLLPFASLFAAVCTLNCLSLYAWEHEGAEGSRHRGASPDEQAHTTTRWAVGHLPTLDVAVICTSLLAALCTMRFAARSAVPELFADFAFACATAATLLLLLHAGRGRLRPLSLRAAADAALLTPAIFLLPPLLNALHRAAF